MAGGVSLGNTELLAASTHAHAAMMRIRIESIL